MGQYFELFNVTKSVYNKDVVTGLSTDPDAITYYMGKYDWAPTDVVYAIGDGGHIIYYDGAGETDLLSGKEALAHLALLMSQFPDVIGDAGNDLPDVSS